MKLIYVLMLLFAFSTEGFAQKYLLDEDVNKDTIIPKVGHRRKLDLTNYSGYGFVAGPDTKSPPSEIQSFNSWQFRGGVWGRVKLTRCLAAGTFIEYSREAYRLKNPIIDSLNNENTIWTKQINNNLVAGIFSRINLKKDKVFADVGAYYAFDLLPRILMKSEPSGANYKIKKTTYNRPAFINRNNYGFDVRLTYGSLALYGRYRISGLYKNQDYDLPKLMIGLLVDFNY